jgi:nucleotide-binding universal stress UspA family protein
MFTRILVPLDGSSLAERALPYAEALAGLLGTAIHIVRVVDVAAFERFSAIGYAPMAAGELLADEDTRTASYLADVKRDMEGRGFHVTTDRLRGQVVNELVAQTQEGDLIVMASHGRGGLTRVFLGSVAEGVMRRSTVPVMLVRADHVQPVRAPAHRDAQTVLTTA